MTKAIEDTALYQSIHQQPAAVAEVLARTAPLCADAAALLRGCRRTYVVGTGTSLHGARISAYQLRAAGIDAEAVAAFDFALYPRPLAADTAVVTISHRGTKLYGRMAIEQAVAAGAPVIGITGQGSPMTGPAVVIETVASERSATYTISHLGALTVLAGIAGAVDSRGDLAAALPGLPELLARTLACEPAVREIAAATTADTHFAFVGGGPNEATATEAALKVKEAAYMVAEGHGIEQFLHGPIVGMHAGDLFVGCGAEGPSAERLRATALGAAAIGMEVVNIGIDTGVDGARTIPVPPVLELLSPMLLTVPVQLLACFLAEARGTDPDTFRQEQEPYKRASGHYKL